MVGILTLYHRMKSMIKKCILTIHIFFNCFTERKNALLFMGIWMDLIGFAPELHVEVLSEMVSNLQYNYCLPVIQFNSIFFYFVYYDNFVGTI